MPVGLGARTCALMANDRDWLDQNDIFRHELVLAAIAADLEGGRKLFTDGQATGNYCREQHSTH
jgi:hypothetical protein